MTLKFSSIFKHKHSSILRKIKINDLAIFGGQKLFERPRSTSNLFRPDIEKYLKYSRVFFDAKHYTNNGPVSQLLEQRLAKFHDVEYCRVFSSGFWAIALAMRLLSIKGRDEVIMPSLTYRRMADIAAWIPLKPHYCEVSPTDLSMTPETVSACINDRTAIILATHPIVNCCDAEGLEELGLQYGIPVIFDSVESVFETLQNRRIGSFGAAECFSLHACKLLNGFGGGYLTTNDGDLARKLSSVRTFGFLSNDHIGISGGLNAKLNEMHAALALASLDDLDVQIQLNRERYYLYKHLLRKNRCVKLVEFDEENQSGYKNIVIKLTEKWPLPRDVTIKVLNAENILARAHYSPPLHRKSHHIPHKAGDMCKTDSLSEHFLNLPCGQRVNNDDIFEIVALIEFLKQNAKKILQTVRVG